MLFDLIQEEFKSKMLIGVYSAGIAIVSALMLFQYLTDQYLVFFSSMVVFMTFVFGLIYVTILRNQRNFAYVIYPVSAILLLASLLQILYSPHHQSALFYITLIFFFFYLPFKETLLFGLITAVLALILIVLEKGWLVGLKVGASNLFILGASYFLFFYLSEKANHIKQRSLIDPVSFAYKESRYRTLLVRETQRSRNEHHELSLIAIAIDDYEQLQELYGRQALLDFLPEFVRQIQSRVRIADEVSRVSDDTFIITLAHCGEEGASVLMERMLNSFQQKQWSVFADIALMSATATLGCEESHTQLNRRLMAKLEKQKRASAIASSTDQPSPFSTYSNDFGSK